MHFFSFSVTWWRFRTSRTVLKYSRSCFAVSPYGNTSSTMISDATLFSLDYLANLSYSIYSFIIISTNVGASFRPPIGTTFHFHFPSRVKNASISHASSYVTTFQYSLSMSTVIKYFAYVSISCTSSSQQGGGKWVSGLVQFLVVHAQTPLVLVPWQVFLMWFCS